MPKGGKRNKKKSSLLNESSTPKSTPKSNKKNKSKSSPTKNKNNKENKKTTKNDESGWTLKQKLLYAAAFIAFISFFIMLKFDEEQYGWSGITRNDNDDDTSLYEILEVDSSASHKSIKKAYRSLSLKYHPDRNPNCGKKCDEMTSKINKAYETLSDPSKRKIYDSTQGSLASIPSNAIELTYDNFDDYVTNSRGVFIVQVYAEHYAECKSFSPVWEEAIAKFDGYVQFGRVHATKHTSVVRRLGASVRMYPTVLSYVDGRYHRMYPAIKLPKTFFNLIHEDYPTHQLWKGDTTKLNKIHYKWTNSDPKLPLLMVASKKLNPSLLVSWMAQQYDGIIKFVHVYPKSMSKTHAEATKQSTGSMRFLSKELTNVFGVKTFRDYPKLITISPQGESKLIEEKINKNNLKKFARKYVQSITPRFNSWSYTSVCGDHDIICIIYMIGCDGTKKRDKLKFFQKLSKKTTRQLLDIEENYHPKWMQFGYINVIEDKDLYPLCHSSNDTELIVVSNAQTTMTISEKKVEEYDDQTLFEYMEKFLEHESDTPIVDAPRIVAPPGARRGRIDDMIEFFEELDWRDKDLQLNVIIICCLIGSVYACKTVGLKGAVMTIFAMSIVGGALPMLMAFMQPQPQGRPRPRTRK